MGEYNPCERNYIYQFNKKLNIEKIKEATKYFIGIHDFKAFTPNKDKRNSYVREIYEINVQEENNILTFKSNITKSSRVDVHHSFGASINVLLYASTLSNTTIIENIALEPEVTVFIKFLKVS